MALGGFDSANGDVNSILELNGAVYVGGNFTTFGGEAHKRLAVVSSASGRITSSWVPEIDNGTVMGMTILGDNIYVVGTFTSVQGGTTRNRAAAFNRFTGILQPWNPNLGANGLGITTDGTLLYVVGGFTTVNGAVTRNRAVCLDSAVGSITPWNPSLNGNANAVVLHNGLVYIGGAFTLVNAVTFRTNIAAFDTAAGIASAAFDADIVGASVNSIIIRPSGALLLGGSFSSSNGAARQNIAEVDKTTGLPSSFAPQVNGLVETLLQVGSFLYVGGTFSDVGGGFYPRNNSVALNATTGNVYSWDPSPNGILHAEDNDGTRLVYLGGAFTLVGGAAKQGFAAIMPPTTQFATPNITPTNSPTITVTSTITPTSTITSTRTATSTPTPTLTATP